MKEDKDKKQEEEKPADLGVQVSDELVTTDKSGG